MSTRANIKINDSWGNSIILYHHSNGYPEWLGKQLDLLCRSEIFYRMDAYEMATYLIKENFRIAEERLQKKNVTNTEILNEKTGINGYELTNTWHGDIEYAYTINKDTEKARLRCYKVKQVVYNEEKDESKVQYNKIEMDIQYKTERI